MNDSDKPTTKNQVIEQKLYPSEYANYFKTCTCEAADTAAPCITHRKYGSKTYLLDGKVYKTTVLTETKSTTIYYQDGLRHRAKGPAFIEIDFEHSHICEAYYHKGVKHREGGPAATLYYNKGHIWEEYYYDGRDIATDPWQPLPGLKNGTLHRRVDASGSKTCHIRLHFFAQDREVLAFLLVSKKQLDKALTKPMSCSELYFHLLDLHPDTLAKDFVYSQRSKNTLYHRYRPAYQAKFWDDGGVVETYYQDPKSGPHRVNGFARRFIHCDGSEVLQRYDYGIRDKFSTKITPAPRVDFNRLKIEDLCKPLSETCINPAFYQAVLVGQTDDLMAFLQKNHSRLTAEDCLLRPTKSAPPLLEILIRKGNLGKLMRLENWASDLEGLEKIHAYIPAEIWQKQVPDISFEMMLLVASPLKPDSQPSNSFPSPKP